MSALVCPLCGRRWVEGHDHWARALAAPGRIPGYVWGHQSAHNPKTRCCYVDGGTVGEARPPTTVLARHDNTEHAA